MGGERIGIYRKFEVQPGERDFRKEFDGRIPGYVNKMLRYDHNPSRVSLVWADRDSQSVFYYDDFRYELPRKWRRYDNHPIPFNSDC